MKTSTLVGLIFVSALLDTSAVLGAAQFGGQSSFKFNVNQPLGAGGSQFGGNQFGSQFGSGGSLYGRGPSAYRGNGAYGGFGQHGFGAGGSGGSLFGAPAGFGRNHQFGGRSPYAGGLYGGGRRNGGLASLEFGGPAQINQGGGGGFPGNPFGFGADGGPLPTLPGNGESGEGVDGVSEKAINPAVDLPPPSTLFGGSPFFGSFAKKPQLPTVGAIGGGQEQILSFPEGWGAGFEQFLPGASAGNLVQQQKIPLELQAIADLNEKINSLSATEPANPESYKGRVDFDSVNIYECEFEAKENTDYSDGENNFALSQFSLEDCQTLCNVDKECVGFVYNAEESTCSRRKEMKTSVEAAGVTSYVKGECPEPKKPEKSKEEE